MKIIKVVVAGVLVGVGVMLIGSLLFEFERPPMSKDLLIHTCVFSNGIYRQLFAQVNQHTQQSSLGQNLTIYPRL